MHKTFVKEAGVIVSMVHDLTLHAMKHVNLTFDEIFPEDGGAGSVADKRRNKAKEVVSQIKTADDATLLKFGVVKLLQQYQEQANVLDPILADIIEPMMRLIQMFARKSTSQNEHAVPTPMSHIFEIIYNLCSVRGYKTVVRFMPHEAADMEPCVELLWFQNQGLESNDQYWVPCVLTLWLSMIVIVPFDLQTIDSQKETPEAKATKSTYEQLVKRIINLGYENVQNTGKLRDYTAILFSKLLSRPDVLK